MAYDSVLVANHIVQLAQDGGRSLSIMSLLKLSYIAHGWTLALLGKPLVKEQVEAWQYGPVISRIYYVFRPQGVHNLSKIVFVGEHEIDPAARDVIEQTYDVYGGLTSKQMSTLTHTPGGPWDKVFSTKGIWAVIPNDDIRRHYLALQNERAKRT